MGLQGIACSSTAAAQPPGHQSSAAGQGRLLSGLHNTAGCRPPEPMRAEFGLQRDREGPHWQEHTSDCIGSRDEGCLLWLPRQPQQGSISSRTAQGDSACPKIQQRNSGANSAPSLARRLQKATVPVPGRKQLPLAMQNEVLSLANRFQGTAVPAPGASQSLRQLHHQL